MLGPRSRWVPGGQRGVPQKGRPPPWQVHVRTLLKCSQHCAQGFLTSCLQQDLDKQELIQRSGQEAERLVTTCNLETLQLFWREGKGWEGHQGDGQRR